MTLNELIETLQDMADDLGNDDPQVNLAIQPSYPLASSLRGVTFRDGTVWLLEGSSQGYGDRTLWEG